MKIYKYNSINAVNQKLAELGKTETTKEKKGLSTGSVAKIDDINKVLDVKLLTTPTGTILYFVITNEVEKLEEKSVTAHVKTVIKEPKPVEA